MENNTSESLVGTPCSLSWFLVQNDNAWAAKHGKYYITQAMQLTPKDENEVFVSMDAEYKIGKETVTGKVLAASEEIQFVRDEMKKLIDLDHINEKRDNYFCLVQCRPRRNHLFYKIVHRNGVFPVLLGEGKMRCVGEKVLIKNGNKMCQGLVLMRNSSLDEVQKELWKLRTKSYINIYHSFYRNTRSQDERNSPEDIRKMLDDNPWVLLLYSCSEFECIYTIVRYNDTVRTEDNEYPGAQVFLTSKQGVHKAMILYRSQRHEELVTIINMLPNPYMFNDLFEPLC